MIVHQSTISSSSNFQAGSSTRTHSEGFDPQLFISEVNSDFLCPICNFVVRRPRECIICGNIFCDGCIRLWAEKLNKLTYLHLSPNSRVNTLNSQIGGSDSTNNIIITECPMKCKSNSNIRESIMKPVGKVVKNLLYQLQIKCPNTSCEKVLTLDKYEEHEFYCFLPKCQNTLCGQGSDKQVSVSCILNIHIVQTRRS